MMGGEGGWSWNPVLPCPALLSWVSLTSRRGHLGRQVDQDTHDVPGDGTPPPPRRCFPGGSHILISVPLAWDSKHFHSIPCPAVCRRWFLGFGSLFRKELFGTSILALTFRGVENSCNIFRPPDTTLEVYFLLLSTGV